jgi:uncharacterized protein (TIGR03437 family)
MYATGLGAVTPAVSAGTPAAANPLSTTVSTVTTEIAGRDATVTFAGLAPNMIDVYQVNIIVPPSTPSGTVRPGLFAGGSGSQTGVTIEIK